MSRSDYYSLKGTMFVVGALCANATWVSFVCLGLAVVYTIMEAGTKEE